MNTSANSFVTLKDIADELGVNYKTLLSCKQRFNDYILAASFGRTARYSKEWADFFKLTFALLDEGYQTDEIKKLLDEGVQDEKDEFIKEGPSGNSVGNVFKLTSGIDRVRRRKNRSPS